MEGSGNGYEDPIAAVFDRYSHFPPLVRLLAVDLHSLLSEYHLVKVDRASMRTSLEVRVPFLDIDFVRMAFRLSPELRLHGGQTKGLLREAMKDMLPDTVVRRGKMGFGPPLKHWFAGELSGFVRERLEDSLAVKEGLLNRKAIDALLRGGRGKVRGVQIWRLLVLESWLRGVREGRFTRPVRSLVPTG
jgi:asparagine synthase (glutamine-hydrolysing)